MKLPAVCNWALLLAGVLLGVQALGALAFAALLASEIQPARAGMGIGTTVIMLGYGIRQPPTTWAGLLMALVALAVLVCVLAPASTRVFLGQDPPAA